MNETRDWRIVDEALSHTRNDIFFSVIEAEINVHSS